MRDPGVRLSGDAALTRIALSCSGNGGSVYHLLAESRPPGLRQRLSYMRLAETRDPRIVTFPSVPWVYPKLYRARKHDVAIRGLVVRSRPRIQVGLFTTRPKRRPALPSPAPEEALHAARQRRLREPGRGVARPGKRQSMAALPLVPMFRGSLAVS
ncbi:hypothetical protein GQ53DRAFT_531887 [Thozetella sp. PMI_491]|nr:hypothetical protein GQ53DRAFT_531887 [Thozetella sp. PMI_491]